MFTAVGISIKQLFSAITVMFLAFEKTAKAIDHLAAWSEETAHAFADAARIERAKQLAVLQSELTLVENNANKSAKASTAAAIKAA